MKRKSRKSFEFEYDEKLRCYRLQICDKDVFPLILVAPNKTERTLHFKERGKKGPSLYIN